ncbi:MAG: adenosylmethionine decarboxylase [Acidobacteriota bacterium]
MKTIGRHLIAEFYRCDVALLDDLDGIQALLLETAQVVRATVLGHTFHQFSPQGVSGTVVISESHLSIHTWPEYGYVSVDIYTCGGLDPHPGFRFLRQRLGAGSTRVQEIVRGLPENRDAAAPPLPADVTITSRMTSMDQVSQDA